MTPSVPAGRRTYPADVPGSPARGHLAERRALLTGGALLLLAVLVGWALNARGVPLHADSAPFFSERDWHVGPGTPVAVVVAVLVVAWGHRLATRLPWRTALLAAGVTTTAWTTALAMSRGWQEGVLRPLSRKAEYLSEVRTAPPLHDLLTGFVARIPSDAHDRWTTHVAGHPPGALMVYVGLDKLGLGGRAPAAVLSLVCAGVTVVLVGVAVRALSGEAAGRAVLPYAVLAPAAVWAGVSADAVFTAVGALGLAALCVAVTRDGRDQPGSPGLAWAAGAGLVLGVAMLMSYGLVLLALPALFVATLRRAWGALVVAAAAAGAVLLAVGLAGFWWWEGLAALHGRYLGGFGGDRPWAYFAWAGPAGLVAVLGPATVAGLGRLTTAGGRRDAGDAGTALALGGTAAVLLAAVSGLSKGETERIWLPFAAWMGVAVLALSRRDARGWLAAQAVTAVVLEHWLVPIW